MFVRGVFRVGIGGRYSDLDVLFDTGSSVTLMSREVLARRFGVEPKPLKRPRTVYALNGTKLTIDSYVDGEIIIEGEILEERIYISRDIVGEAKFKGKTIKFPELIVGISTMEAWGIELDIKRGRVTVKGAGILF